MIIINTDTVKEWIGNRINCTLSMLRIMYNSCKRWAVSLVTSMKTSMTNINTLQYGYTSTIDSSLLSMPVHSLDQQLFILALKPRV